MNLSILNVNTASKSAFLDQLLPGLPRRWPLILFYVVFFFLINYNFMTKTKVLVVILTSSPRIKTNNSDN